MKNIKQTAASWVIKETEGLNSCEQNNLDSWLKQDPTHQKAYSQEQDIRESFNTMPKGMRDILSKKASKGIKRTNSIQKIKPILIAALFLLSISFSYYKYQDYSKPIFSNTYVSSTLKENSIILPDGSHIVLDVKTSIKVSMFQNKREVNFLKGKALFTVAKDKNRPFIIHSLNTQIEVVGTIFEVSKINEQTQVNVKEGIVKISQTYSNKTSKVITLLNKAQSITINKAGKVLNYGNKDINIMASWEKGYLLFNQTSLKEAITTFSRYSTKTILLENETVKNTQITGKFSIQEFDKFLNALPKIYTLKIEEKNKVFNILEK